MTLQACTLLWLYESFDSCVSSVLFLLPNDLSAIPVLAYKCST